MKLPGFGRPRPEQDPECRGPAELGDRGRGIQYELNLTAGQAAHLVAIFERGWPGYLESITNGTERIRARRVAGKIHWMKTGHERCLRGCGQCKVCGICPGHPSKGARRGR